MDRFKFRVWIEQDNRWYARGRTLEIWEVPSDNSGFYTIEQCTGLKDKNGKLIFEGDLVGVYADGAEKAYHPSIQVIWSDRYAEYICQASNSLGHYISLYYNIEIIGNIHEVK